MILSLMRFAGFEWSHNPLDIGIHHKRSVYSTATPYTGEQVDALCREISRVSGKGELVGDDCIERYRALEKLFESVKKGVLTLPGMPPFEAYFTRLEAEGQSAPNVLVYSVEFISADNEQKDRKEFCICRSNDTLFDVAYEYDVAVEELVRLNPHIKRPDMLADGERVRLC